jgi:putative endonuclease
MTHVADGQAAEDAAAAFLERRGCTIIGRNWKHRLAEIDIVAYREDVVYFCEVKYRLTGNQGHGLDYITPAKLKRMHFAAQLWQAQNNWQGACQLSAIEVSGPDYRVTAAIRDIL